MTSGLLAATIRNIIAMTDTKKEAKLMTPLLPSIVNMEESAILPVTNLTAAKVRTIIDQYFPWPGKLTNDSLLGDGVGMPLQEPNICSDYIV